MALETAPYINGLVSSNPAAGDALANADDHLRLIKAALLATFPNITGPVTAPQAALNVDIVSLTGTQTLTNKTLTSPAINTPTVVGGSINDTPVGATTPDTGSFTTLAASGAVSFLPSGIGVLWWGLAAAVPTGWKLCDGTNSTPDMRGAFARGAPSSAVGGTGGSADAVVVDHNHTATVTDPQHIHTTTFETYNSVAASGARIGVMDSDSLSNNGSETYDTASSATGITVANTAAGVSGTNANLPPYKEWHYIMRI